MRSAMLGAMSWAAVLAGCAAAPPLATLPDGSPVRDGSFVPTQSDPYVLLECTVQADGSITGCAILEERPSGEGFGAAALETSRRGRLNTRTPGFVAGAKIRYPVRFRAQD